MSTRRNAFVTVSALALIATAGAAHGQSLATAEQAGVAAAAAAASAEGDPEGGQIAEVIVTAQKRSERLSDVPLSISAATGEQLRDRGVTQVADLERLVPGFVFQKSTYGQPIFSIRGIGFFDNSLASAPTVSVYVDQAPLPFSVMTPGATLDLERVEVLKGPQGTLFGQNSTGGAVNYIAAKPTRTFEAGVEGTYGRFNEFDLEGFVSGPLTDTLAARLAVRTEQRGDWQRSISRDDSLGERHFTSARFLLDWRPTDRLAVLVSLNGFVDRSDTQAAQAQAYFPIDLADNYWNADGFLRPYIASHPIQSNDRAADWDANRSLRRDDNFYQGTVRADYEVADGTTLTTISAYSQLKTEAPTDLDGTPWVDLFSDIHGSLKSFSQEARLAGTGLEGRLKWMVGGNYQRDNVLHDELPVINFTGAGAGPFPFDNPRLINHQWVETVAGFASLDYQLTSTLTLQGSVRYTDQDRKWQGCAADGGAGGFARAFSFLSTIFSGTPTVVPPGGCGTMDSTGAILGPAGIFKPIPLDQARQKSHENNTSWRLGASWKPQPDMLLYANVTKGYKAGGFSTTPALLFKQERPIPQESVLAYEAGAKLSLLDRRLQLNGSVFYYDYSDKQLIGYLDVGPPFGTLPGLVSIPKSSVAGAEVEATFKPTSGLTLGLGGTYLKSKIRSHYDVVDPFSAEAGVPLVDIKGEAFPNTPKWQLFGDVEYRFTVNSDWEGVVGAHASYHSRTKASFGQTALFDQYFQIDPYVLVDLRAGVESTDGRWRAQVWAKNAFNKYYWGTVSRVNDIITRQTGMPATYGVTVGRRF